MANEPISFEAYRARQKPLETGGGGGDFGGMEARVARLEEDVKDLKADAKAIRGDLGDLKVKLAEIGAKLDGLSRLADKVPTGWTFFGIIASTIALVMAAAIAFKPLAQWAGALP